MDTYSIPAILLKWRSRKMWPIFVLSSLACAFLLPQYSLGYFGDYDMIAVGKQFSVLLPADDVLANSLYEQIMIVQGHTIAPINNPDHESDRQADTAIVAIKKKVVVITAYSSTPQETDSSPFITASGTRVRDGVVAANFLKFGTKVKIPQIYGDKIFVVEDRMAPRNSNKVDVWMPSRGQALQFGVKQAEIIVLGI